MGSRKECADNRRIMEKREPDRDREAVPSLLFWYDYNARILPWREDPTLYHV